MNYKVISADAHIVEPPHLWEKFLNPEFKQFAPRMIKDAEGGDAWQYGPGAAPAPMGLVTVIRGRKYSDPNYQWNGIKISEVNQGAFYGDARLKEQDEDGIDAEVIYPPIRTMMYFMSAGNSERQKEIALAGIQAYNDWMSQDFCAADPDRLIGLAMIPNLGIEASLAELRRCAAMGKKGCVIMAWPAGGDLISEEDEPFWAEAERLNMPVSIHIMLAARRAGTVDVPSHPLVRPAVVSLENMPRLIGETVYSGIFDRYPNLRFVGGEVNVGWVPGALELLDDHYQRDRYWTKAKLEKDKPSDYYRSNWGLTFIIDKFGVKFRHEIGIETMLWSNDYPHHRCDWLESQRLIEEHMVGVPADERYLMTAGNAVRIYGLDTPSTAPRKSAKAAAPA